MEKEIYETPSIKLAATLLTLGFNIVGINNLNPQNVNFLFDYTDELKETIKEFWQGTLRVEPNSLFVSRDQLLSRIKESVYN